MVSIVIPCLNGAEYLNQTIRSAVTQKYCDVEVWVIDGGSTDGTPEILAGWLDKINWISEPDDGQSAAINKGWRKCHGEIFCWLNADDILMPGALETVQSFFDTHPEVDILFGNCDLLDHSGKKIGTYPARPFDLQEVLLSTLDVIPQPAAFFRRRVIDRTGGLDESLHYVMDFDFFLRAAMNGCIFEFIPQVLAGLRLHKGAKSIRSLEYFAPELIRTFAAVYESLPPGDPLLHIRKTSLQTIYYRASYCAYWGNNTGLAREYSIQAVKIKPGFPPKIFFLAIIGKPFKRILDLLGMMPGFLRGVNS